MIHNNILFIKSNCNKGYEMKNDRVNQHTISTIKNGSRGLH